MLGVLVAGAALWGERRSHTYIVNLVPAVAAVGKSEGRPTPAPPPPAPPPREETPPPRAAPPRPEAPPPRPAPPRQETVALSRTPPPELPRREAAREIPRELPPPERSREPSALPERGLAPRPPGLPRPSDKELPPVTSGVATKPLPALPPPPAPRSEAAAPAPPPPPAPPAPLGSPTGSPQGAGAVTLNVADFPYAWYVRLIHQKIQEKWDGRALEGRQPSVIFEIGREGQLRRVVIDKSSGNPYYDQLALRAIADANPFPPLPPEFAKSVLTVGLQFAHEPATR